MAERSYPFVKDVGSTTEPGTTTDAEYSQFFRLLAVTGVSGSADGSELRPYGDSSGLFVKGPVGRAVVRGHFYTNTSVIVLPITVGGSLARIDSIVLRMEYAGVNDIHMVVKQGTPSSNPSAPPLTQTDTGVFELLLGNVLVPIEAATILASNVSDARTFTGISWSTLQGVPSKFTPDAHTHPVSQITGLYVQQAQPSNVPVNSVWMW